MQYIHVSELEGKRVLCFDTGLDPRTFARAKMSRHMAEAGYIVFPDGSNSEWKAAGVTEQNDNMIVWGQPFPGERLDLIIKNNSQQAALQAIVFWVKAKLFLSEHSSLDPGAAFIVCDENDPQFPRGCVFFSPENLTQRCLVLENAEPDNFNSSDLTGMEAAAFCAAAMLYKVLCRAHPYPDQVHVSQDMRDGIFMPPGLAMPGLNDNLCSLIQSALNLPVKKMNPGKIGASRTGSTGTEILNNMLGLLMKKDGNAVPVSSLFSEVSEEKQNRINNEIKLFTSRKNSIIKTKRFVSRNKQSVVLSAVALFIVLVFAVSMIQTHSSRPTTEGMSPYQVINAYFKAFSSLDHIMMEACIRGASKTDIDVIINFFVIDRVRQAYEPGKGSLIISAMAWQEAGNELPAPNVFGITDLAIVRLGGSEDAGTVVYRADYIVWYPHEPIYSIRTDELTLSLDRRKRWRITDIQRDEKLEMAD